MNTCPQCGRTLMGLNDGGDCGVCQKCYMKRANHVSVAGFDHTKDAWQMKEMVDKGVTKWSDWTMIGYTESFGDDLFVPNEYMVYPWKELT